MIVSLGQSSVVRLTIAETLGISQSDVSRIWRRYIETGNVNGRPRSGCPRVTTPAQDRYMRINTPRNNNSSTASEIRYRLRAASGVQLSDQTVRNRLREGGLRARRPMRRPYRNRQHRQNRLQWARDHQKRTAGVWSHVLFGRRIHLASINDTMTAP
ncbi:hypothetical protein PR048_015844 [Dryococelus australis]|uniref:Transposase Tc1-like domain-containing protein n=1 Tax=Dryococelus australis TaxID=614101 RepID=A0ABQ9HJ67_9NEOP|nr:hypothetical protein PR048_015844 [Dryococelus australis]